MKKILLKGIFLLAIFGTVTLSAQTYKFDQPENVEGFVIHTEFSTVEQSVMVDTDGVMVFTMPDPGDLIPTSMRVDQSGVIDATTNKFMTIRLQNNTDIVNLRLKIASDPKAIWTVPIELTPNSSEFITYVLEIKNVAWTGDLSNIFFQFRIPGKQMPITGTTLVIDEIAFTSEAPLSVGHVIKDNARIKLFPNPVHNELKVNSTSTIAKIEVYNVLGQKALSMENSNALNVSDLLAGIYVAKIFNDKGVISTKQFVKE